MDVFHINAVDFLLEQLGNVAEKMPFDDLSGCKFCDIVKLTSLFKNETSYCQERSGNIVKFIYTGFNIIMHVFNINAFDFLSEQLGNVAGKCLLTIFRA